MKLRAIIIDDEKNGVAALKLLIQKYVPTINIVATTTDPEDGITLINNYQPEIVFLDISMPKLNGFEMLEKLSYKQFNLIFTTAHNQHGIQAIKNNAIDYLLKPIRTEELIAAVERVVQKQLSKQSVADIAELLRDFRIERHEKIALPTRTSIEYVPTDLLVIIEADSNNAQVTTKTGQLIKTSKSLKEIEAQICIPGSKFLRVHHSYIVNIDYINKYLREDGGQLELMTKKTVPISRSKKEELLALLNAKSLTKSNQ